MTLGGLKEGVTPLEMAYAYSTIANNGKRVYGSFSPSSKSPVAIAKVQDGDESKKNERKTVRVLPEGVAKQTKGLLRAVVTSGTGTKANVPVWAAGKTGTTENYGDAWFVGFTDRYTVAVWVGYPDKLKYMKTEYQGGPVAGGTYPTEIWRDFIMSAIKIDESRGKGRGDEEDEETPAVPVAPTTPGTTPTTPGTPQQEVPQAPEPAPAPGTGGGGAPAPDPAPAPAPAPQTPAPAPTPPPEGGGGGTGAPGAAE
jgi:penicillin-binding protein 1A